MTSAPSAPSINAAPASAADVPGQPRRGWLLALSATLFALWVCGLIVLAATSANPVQVNLRQLAQSRFLVAAQVENAASGECRVLERWSPGPLADRIRVSNLDKTGAVAGRQYVLPLVYDPIAGAPVLRVVDDPAREIPPLVYARTSDVEQKIRDWQRATP